MDKSKQLTVEQQSKQLLTADDIQSNVQLIQSVMKEIMQKDTHYGIIPGTKKNTLYKAGSEVILSAFRVAVDPEITDLSTEDEIRYLVKAKGYHITTGNHVGTGVGEASTNEEKYKWRKAVCDAEFEATPANRRRVKYSSYQGNDKQVKQVRTNPADLANTALKMAKKRAQIDLTLTATAASDIFTQDMDDPAVAAAAAQDDFLPEDYGKPPVSQPQTQAQTTGALVTEGQKKLIYARTVNSKRDDAQNALFTKFGITDYDQLPKSQVNEALEFLDNA